MALVRKKSTTIFNRFALAINCISSLALLISYLAPVANPQQYWIIALFGLIYPFLLLVNFVFIVYWLFSSKRYALIPAICILAGFKILITNFGFHSYSAPKNRSSKLIRIMAYNVRGFLGESLTVPTRDSILKLIDIQQPDVINIEEFSINVDNSKAIYNSLKSIMNPAYHYVKQYEYTQYDSSGVAIFSKYPVINKGNVFATPDSAENQAIYVDLQRGAQIFRVYCVHLKSVRFNDKDHVYLKKLTHYGKVNLPEIKVVKNKLKFAYINRSKEALIIKQHLLQCPYPYIIAGDFNDTPISFSVNTISNGLTNGFKEKGGGLGFTYYGDFPNLQIDYIFASRQFKISSFQCIYKKFSDHYPIVSDMLLDSR